MSLAHCYSIEDLRRRARRKLPSPMFHYIDGGADDEWTLARNTAAFENYALMPRYLRDVTQVDISIEVFGCHLDLPFFLSPTAMSRLFHHERELGVARAAERFGTLYSLSTLSSVTLEDVARTSSGPKMFQIYILKDRELTREFLQRCKAAGYEVLCLTVDTMLAGNREREKRLGMSMPPRITARSFFSYATRFEWLFHVMLDPDFRPANVTHLVDATGGGSVALIDFVNSQFDRSVTWDDAAWLADQWDGPFAIKGMTTPEDAKMAVEIGASAAMLSNHGGRQLDSTPSPLETLAPIRDAVGEQLELIVDGGIRRGTHVLKALALGADACSIGRAYLYGLGAGGQAGVERALALLKEEIERDLALLGCNSLKDLGAQHVKKL